MRRFLPRYFLRMTGAVALAAALVGLGSGPGPQWMARLAHAQSVPVETLTHGHVLPADAGERIYVMDAVFMHLFESRVNIFDGANGKFLGMVPTAYNGHMQLSHDGSKIYVMTTYHTRMTRGERSDVVEIWDARSLTFEREVILPVRRVQGLNYRNMFRQTTDGNFILLQNATPATSTAVVDVKKGRFTEEITATAGCWGVLPKPNKPRSFMSVCGDGALLSMDLDSNGKLVSQSRSKAMFPVATDPVFLTHALEKTKAHFVSFNGNVYTADFSRDDIRFEPVWSLLDEGDKAGNWRPGGYNVVDVHRASRRMYVLMHPDGREGSHKNPAAEIWVYDLASKKRLARIAGQEAIAISVNQGNTPRLLALDGGNVHIYDITEATPQLLRTIEGAGESALQVEPHPVAGGVNG